MVPDRPAKEEETSGAELNRLDNQRTMYLAMNRNKDKWSQGVTRQSNALDLESGVFTLSEPRKIAESLKRSAEQSNRRKATPYQSAMSMLNFYINRAGSNLPQDRRLALEKAKVELQRLFATSEKSGGRPVRRRSRAQSRVARGRAGSN
jgi:Protein of unknown function (DUF3175)